MWTRTDVAIWAAKTSVRMTSASLLSFATGATLSYFVIFKRIEKKYEEISKQEIAEAKKFYGRLHKTDEDVLSPTQLVESLHGKAAVEALRTYQGDEPAHVVTEPLTSDIPVAVSDGINEIDFSEEHGVKNIFTDSAPGDDFDYETEMALRTEDRPYIITFDEFFEGAKNYEQSEITYYQGDRVLADEAGREVPDSDGIVGDENLTKFGHGAKDPHTVYIRNDRISVDFEVTRSTGTYASEVLGIVLEHSDDRRKARQNSPKRRGHPHGT